MFTAGCLKVVIGGEEGYRATRDEPRYLSPSSIVAHDKTNLGPPDMVVQAQLQQSRAEAHNELEKKLLQQQERFDHDLEGMKTMLRKEFEASLTKKGAKKKGK